MKKINGGLGKEIEISEDVDIEIDPESMLDNDSTVSSMTNDSSIPEEKIICVVIFTKDNNDISIVGIWNKFYFLENSIIFEFSFLSKHLLNLIELGFPDLKIKNIKFKFGEEEKILNINSQKLKKIHFKSLRNQIKCKIILSN